MYPVCNDFIIVHYVGRCVPSPAQTDACVGHVFYFIMLYGSIPGITDAYSDTAPIFICGVSDEVVPNRQVIANVSLIFWVIRKMDLACFF
jgi:hypothetical protein